MRTICGKKALFFQPPCFHIVKPPRLFRSIKYAASDFAKCICAYTTRINYLLFFSDRIVQSNHNIIARSSFFSNSSSEMVCSAVTNTLWKRYLVHLSSWIFITDHYSFCNLLCHQLLLVYGSLLTIKGGV
jgi:hypothetical protein